MNAQLDPEQAKALAEVAGSCLCRRVRTAARAVTRFYDRYFVGSGIEPTQFHLLVGIGLSEPVSLVKLAEHLGLERTTLTRNLKLLEHDGLIQTRRGEDARQRLFWLSPRGRGALKKNLPRWKRAQAAAMAALGKDNFARLTDALSLARRFTAI
jgi:DNA-binding MarR family transcriptional regulator